MAPKDVEVVISADGFKKKTTTLKMEEETISGLTYLLEPENPHYWAEHPEEIHALEKVNTEEALKIIDIIKIKDKLPIVKYKYGGRDKESEETVIMNMDTNCRNLICLKVTSNAEDVKGTAEEMIRDKGFNPEDYEIIY